MLNEDHHRPHVDSLGDACVIVDSERRVVSANLPASELYGLTRDEMIGLPFTDLAPVDQRDGIIAELASCNGRPHRFRAIQMRGSGAPFVGDITAKVCLDAECRRIVLLVRESAADGDQCHRDLTLNTLMLNHVRDGIVCHTLDGELLFANQAALGSWGMDSLDEVRALGPFGWVASSQREHTGRIMTKMRETGEARFESHGVTPGGFEAHVEIHANLIETPEGPLIVSTVRDIGERMQAEEMVRYLAYHDTLTGLANRVLLDAELAHALASSGDADHSVGVIFIDLNNFKPVNDTYGHTIGDQVLREVADRIAGSVRDTDTVARTGGDEFVVLLPKVSDPEVLERIALEVVEAVAHPIDVGEAHITVTAAVGLAIHESGEDAESLLTRADLAMYQSREDGSPGWDVFSRQ